jgi:chromate transporter
VTSTRSERSHRLSELARLFLKLGTIAFGGPAAHIAMMEEEVVRRRQWLSHAEFLDLLGATNLIPGPNSTEMAIHIGHRRAGFPGLLVAGTCFIVPAMLIVTACAWAYVRFGKLPQAEALLYGVKPVIMAVVFQALWGLSKSAVKTVFLGAVVALAVGLEFIGVNELIVLLGAGVVTAVTGAVRKRPAPVQIAIAPLPGFKPLLAAVPVGAATVSAPFGLWPLFLFFLKVGSVLYGSGYVLLAFLRSGLVEHFGWLTEGQLLDAIAVGQITPGPVFTTATFIGYLLGGTQGALIATVGIFLPAFFFVAISGPLVPRIRRSAIAGAFLDGVNAASLALMIVVTLQLTRAAVVDWVTLTLALLTAFLLVKYKLNSAWLVAIGAAVGLLNLALGKIS